MAGSGSVTIKLIGMENAMAKMKPSIAGRPIRRFFERGSILIFNEAVSTAPVGTTGRLKGSHAWKVDPAPLPLSATVGTKLDYASDVHFGTPPHYVDPSELDDWARLKKIRGGGQAASEWIAERGTKANPWLYEALSSQTTAIKAFVPVLASEIEQAYGSG